MATDIPSITSLGVGSGLDINGLVTQLMNQERQPLLALDKKEAGLQAQISAYGTVKSALASFQTTVRDLSSLAKFQAFKAISADSSIFTASAAADAVAGSYAIEVKQLAQAHKLVSGAFTNVTDTVGTGTLNIQFGTYNSGTNTFTLNNAKATQTVAISGAADSLSGVRDAINAANIGVTASILNDGTGNRLVLASTDAGAANSLKITVSNDSAGTDVDSAGLSQLAYDPTAATGNGKNLTQTVAAQNALLKVDGVDNISKPTNIVTDVIQGVTLNLANASALNTPTALTVSRDTAAVQSAVAELVQAYNDVNDKLKQLTAYNPTTKEAAALQGDVSTLSLISQIRQTLASPIHALAGYYSVLSQIGISFQRDGTLALDSAKLQSAIDTNFNDIAGLFAAKAQPTDSLVNYIGAGDNTQPGNYALSISQLATQGYLNGTTTAALAHTAGTFTTPFSIDANNDTLAVKVDGVQSGTITLAHGAYTTAAALTAEIQSEINGDSALAAAGASVTVSFDAVNSRLAITSNRYGSVSTVEITSVGANTETTLGFSAAAGTAGVDVAGTINGVGAIGSGRFLTAATGDAEGLKLEVVGGGAGSRGSVNYSQGYAFELDKLVDKLLGTSGPVTSRINGINSSIGDIDEQRDVLNRRLDDTERRYRTQFAALDGLLASLRTTSDFLTRQLSILPNANTTTKANGQ